MWFKSIISSRPTTKGLFVSALVVFLVFGQALQEERYRRSPATETSSLTQISSFNKRQLRPSVNLENVGHWIPKLPKALRDQFDKAAGTRTIKRVVLNRQAAKTLGNWHNHLVRNKHFVPERADDIVLYRMLEILKSEQKVKVVVSQGMRMTTDPRVKELCSSLLKRLSSQKIRSDLFLKVGFEHMELSGMDLGELFRADGFRWWDVLANKYWVKKLGEAANPGDVQYAADESMLNVLIAEHGVPGLIEFLIGQEPFIRRRLYMSLLRTWSEPSAELGSSDIAKLLEIEKWETPSDSARLSAWFDYMVVSMMAVNKANLNGKSILDEFRATFDKTITTKFARHEDESWCLELVGWQSRLKNENHANLIYLAKRYLELY